MLPLNRRREQWKKFNLLSKYRDEENTVHFFDKCLTSGEIKIFYKHSSEGTKYNKNIKFRLYLFFRVVVMLVIYVLNYNVI